MSGKPRKLIFCSGMARSASTWSFNACRLLASKVEEAPRVFSAFAQTPEVLDSYLDEFSDGSTVVILKFHRSSERVFNLLADGAALNVFTFRNPLQAIASARDIFKLDLPTVLGSVQSSLIDMERYQGLPGTLFLSMRDIVSSTRTATCRLAQHLNFEFDPADIDEVAALTSARRVAAVTNAPGFARQEALVDMGFSRYDPVTHLHVGHIRRGLKRDSHEHLSDKEMAICQEALARWFPNYMSW